MSETAGNELINVRERRLADTFEAELEWLAQQDWTGLSVREHRSVVARHLAMHDQLVLPSVEELAEVMRPILGGTTGWDAAPGVARAVLVYLTTKGSN